MNEKTLEKMIEYYLSVKLFDEDKPILVEFRDPVDIVNFIMDIEQGVEGMALAYHEFDM